MITKKLESTIKNLVNDTYNCITCNNQGGNLIKILEVQGTFPNRMITIKVECKGCNQIEIKTLWECPRCKQLDFDYIVTDCCTCQL